jgi:hypothetical protein
MLRSFPPPFGARAAARARTRARTPTTLCRCLGRHDNSTAVVTVTFQEERTW